MARKKSKKRELTKDNILYYQRKYLINRIRQATRYWPYKTVVKNASKVKVEIGIYKNGNPKYAIKYQCRVCKGLYDNVDMDHVQPIVGTEAGFVDWNTYIDNALCYFDNFQPLCESCHGLKTGKEQKKRKKSKK